MATISYRQSSELAVIHRADVAVIGGGPGGIGAAVMAARAGAKTVLIERYGFLGGMATSGEVHPFMPNHADGVCLDRPVYVEWIEAMKSYMSPQHRMRKTQSVEVSAGADRQISKDLAMLAAEDLCLSAGVTLLYHHAFADVIMSQRRIDAVVLLSKSGFTAVQADMFVDTTGDADVAAKAGCAFEEGGPTGHSQPMTLCFKLGNVDRARVPSREEISRLYDLAKERGEMVCPRENVLSFPWIEDDVLHFNTTRVVKKSGTVGLELSEAEIEARRQLRQYLTFLRGDVAGFENAEVYSIAHHIGIRETRRVTGLATLTRDDFRDCAKFDDAIARVNYPIDIHSPDGSGTEHDRLPPGEWYEIPYGCIVPPCTENLLVGGRPISVDHAVHSSMRVMPPACSVGQAAGIAAAMAASGGCSPADLDGCDVRRELRQRGAFL